MKKFFEKSLNINDIATKIKKNENIEEQDFKHIQAADIGNWRDKENGYNLLDWAIKYKNHNNVTVLTARYIHPKDCKLNCFENLFNGSLPMDSAKIAGIAETLLKLKKDKGGITIPSALKPAFNTEDYYIKAQELIKKYLEEEKSASLVVQKKQ